uniref:Deacetylase sirtuin-type domain-containing protein n=1 Tax=Globisporangium ultimum (strain ATCC 200006 / CBS 805.95 / DAOM BR144) TaxID=431595 RepID=K3WVE4_GLOUD
MSASRARLSRRAKLQDVDYAVLASGQQIPEYSSESSSDDDETYGGSSSRRRRTARKRKGNSDTECVAVAPPNGSNKRKRKKLQATDQCFICEKESKSAFMQCEICARWYHYRCWKPFEASSVLGHTSCHECVQETPSNGLDAASPHPHQKIATLKDFVGVLKKAKKILVVAGAGMSVSCGIPDFRSKDGIYAMVRHMDTHLPEPECLFQIEYFRQDPSPFYQLVRNVFAHSPLPSPTHRFLKLLQDKKKLLRVYSQNIDGLEEAAGVTKYIPCHGSFAWSTCMKCKHRVATSTLMDVILAGVIPTCGVEGCRGVLKPDITFFGELLSDHVSTSITKDRLQADLLLVIGTSLKVSPVAEIPGFLPRHIPQVVINKTALKKKKLNKSSSTSGASKKLKKNGRGGEDDDKDEFDLTLLGNCDDIVQHICELTHWDLPEARGTEAAFSNESSSDTRKKTGQRPKSPEVVAIDSDDNFEPQVVRKAKHKKDKKIKKSAPSIDVIAHKDKPHVLCFGECHCTNQLDAQHYHEDDNSEPDGFVCDGCGEDYGAKLTDMGHYRCDDCFDFDLCGACYRKHKHTHKQGQHRFTKVT